MFQCTTNFSKAIQMAERIQKIIKQVACESVLDNYKENIGCSYTSLFLLILFSKNNQHGLCKVNSWFIHFQNS